MTDPAEHATELARHLRARGHAEASRRLEDTLARHRSGGGLLEALREFCQSVLTAVEAIDPASFAAVEELRMEVDRRLDTGHSSG
jgi:hypothetical protein